MECMKGCLFLNHSTVCHQEGIFYMRIEKKGGETDGSALQSQLDHTQQNNCRSWTRGRLQLTADFGCQEKMELNNFQ